jgi:hypothetical protein
MGIEHMDRDIILFFLHEKTCDWHTIQMLRNESVTITATQKQTH